MSDVFGDIPILVKKEKYLKEKPIFSEISEFEACENIECELLPLNMLHQHQFIEIGCVTEGRGVHRIWNDAYPVSVGDLYVLNEAVPHGFFAQSEKENGCEKAEKLSVRSFYFDPEDIFSGNLTEIGEEEYLFGLFAKNNFALPVSLKSRQMKSVLSCFDEMTEEAENENIGWREAITAKLTLLLIDIRRMAETQGSSYVYREKKDSALAAMILQLVRENYFDSAFSLKKAAEMLYKSPSSVSRSFFEITGRHFSDYLRSYRMQQASYLAAETELSNEEIAQRCGYCDFNSFYKQFRSFIGSTPGEFRRSRNRVEEVEENENDRAEKMYNEIRESVLRCRKDDVLRAVKLALEMKLPPEEILYRGLVSGMNTIGEKFHSNEIYVIEVLTAAKAVNESMRFLKPYLIKSGVEPLGRAVICTVKGDLHDIGKNLVKLMIEGEGIECTDLGVDASPDDVVAAVRENDVQLVCLSALLTTTMMALKDVIDALTSAGLRDKVRVMVGGAPVTKNFAESIGADVYTEDAATAATEAKRLILEMKNNV